MDHSRFDAITKGFAASSRRSLLGIAGVSALAAWLGLDPREADAKPKKKKCKKPKSKCGKKCVNLKTSSLHCGGCNQPCPSGQACDGGICKTSGGCPKDQCGTLCVDFQTDDKHCGGCGNDCTANSDGRTECFFGNCVCPGATPTLCPDFSNGGNHCTNPLTDKDNCSPFQQLCGFRCPAGDGHECCNGTCAFLPGCLANGGGWVECQRQHCGQCGSPCTSDFHGCCEGACVDFRQDGNCGRCGVNCADDGFVCCGGVCLQQCP